jgi:hypothetical protein
MALRKPTDIETMRVLHYLWKHSHLSQTDIRHLLLVIHGLKITNISEEVFELESLDKKIKYSIK